jgi:hypothetical protein
MAGPNGPGMGGAFDPTRDYSPAGQWFGLEAVFPLLRNLGATYSLSPSQCGSTIFFDSAAGQIITLPAPQVGLWYDFVVGTSVTSNNHTVITDVSTTLLIGSIWLAVSAGTGTQYFPNGSSHVKCQMNGTTTGGLKNTNLTLACVSSTQWIIDGTIEGSGTIATPFA